MAGAVSRRVKRKPQEIEQVVGNEEPEEDVRGVKDGRRREEEHGEVGRGKGAAGWLAMLITLLFGMWVLFRYQMEVLPFPVSERGAGVRGFSEERAYRHVQALSSLGPHPLRSLALQKAVQYVYDQAVEIQETANYEVEVEVDRFQTAPGRIGMKGGLFKGRSLVYSGLEYVVVRLHPKYDDDALENAILVSSHVDTVNTAEGAGDCSSCVGVMLELARALSHWAHGFKHSVIFLFNTGEEEGLIGAHSFMTQHPWRESIRAAIDLEAMGVGGKSFLFQGGPDSWLVETFAKVAKWPATMMLAQDIFHSGLVKSATDFQIFREVAGLSGLDFAYMENAAVYHTKNDKLSLLRPGSLQHSGDNMLPFLLELATLPELASRNMSSSPGFSNMDVVYWDVLGWYMLTYSQGFAKLLHYSVIFQLGILQVNAIVLSGFSSLVAACLALLAIYLTWCFAIGFTLFVAMIVPAIGSSAVPFLASPWLVIPLYCVPAAIGALIGHHFGHMLLVGYLWHVDEEQQKQKKTQSISDQITSLRGVVQHAPATVLCEAERWLYKAGIMQWVLVLGLTTWAKAGAAYLPLAWVVGPTVAYGLLEIRLSPRQALRPLRHLTFWLGVLAPTVLTALPAFHFPRILINMLVNFDRNPGGLPEWTGSVMLACVCAIFTTLMLVYLLPYVHRSGGLPYILGLLGAVLLFALAAVALSVFPAFTGDIGRGINVVHVIDTDGQEGGGRSFLSLASVTMGNLKEEAKHMGDADLVCGRNSTLDFATYTVKYGCQKPVPLDEGLWLRRPSLVVIKDEEGPPRVTTVRLEAGMARRWFLAISSNKVERLQLEAVTDSTSETEKFLVPTTDISGVDGWHIIQYNGPSIPSIYGYDGINGPSIFLLTLHWSKNATDAPALLKLRTDVPITTPQAEKMLEDVPEWCLSFGKSTSPYPLAYLATLPVDFDKESAT
ncbi:hypothetical protein M758_7G029700 [Ceratodon purpureus]|nr:hypothetical protein M758_7G029700 [Ceratodon purpureus]